MTESPRKLKPIKIRDNAGKWTGQDVQFEMGLHIPFEISIEGVIYKRRTVEVGKFGSPTYEYFLDQPLPVVEITKDMLVGVSIESDAQKIVKAIARFIEDNDDGRLSIRWLDGDENPAGMWRPPGYVVEWGTQKDSGSTGFGETLLEAMEDADIGHEGK